MKKIAVFVFIALFTSSCASMYSETVYMADFRPYSEVGFFITPALSINESYQSIGALEIEFTPGIRGKSSGRKIFYTPSYSEIMDKLVDQAVTVGANAILGFKITANYSSGKVGLREINHYTASGFAVKIDGKPIPHTQKPMKNPDIQESPLFILTRERVPWGDFPSEDVTILYLDEKTGKYISQKEYIKKYGNEKFQELNNKICVTN